MSTLGVMKDVLDEREFCILSRVDLQKEYLHFSYLCKNIIRYHGYAKHNVE